MRAFCCSSTIFLLLTVLCVDAVKAHEGESVAPAEPSDGLSYEEFRLKQLHYLAGRSRTGVIVSSAVTVAGVSLVTPFPFFSAAP